MRKRKVICCILLSGALLYSGIFAVQGAEHRVIRSTSNDYQKIEMYFCWDKIVYQVANQKSMVLETDSISTHPTAHYPIWIKSTEQFESGDYQGEYSFAGRYLDSAELNYFTDGEAGVGMSRMRQLTNMLWE